jgi:4-hydroxyproline epimerase
MTARKPGRVEVVDSHTGGEPTRVVVAGGPDLGTGPIAERLERFRRDHDRFRSAIVNEPRGSDVLVGALLCEPEDRTCVAGVIFFNNVGVLGMCGHGTIGLVATLSLLRRIKPGDHRIETPVGIVTAGLLPDGVVRIENVPSYRHAKGVEVTVDGRTVRGDVAWGGNWFYLVDAPDEQLALANVDRLTAFTRGIRRALAAKGVTGAGGGEIDHIELFAPSPVKGVDSRNFVLCPGGAYDRSPCGTGTSAKAACLYEEGRLKEGQVWRQESILGSVFEASVRLRDGKVIPTIQGSAHVTGVATLILDPEDPFVDGIRR